MSYVAEYEAVKISENTKRKLAELKAKGKKLGRPSKFARLRPELERLRSEGVAIADVARALGVRYNSAKSYLARLDELVSPDA